MSLFQLSLLNVIGPNGKLSSHHVLQLFILFCCIVLPFYSSDNSLPKLVTGLNATAMQNNLFSHDKNRAMIQFDPDQDRLFCSGQGSAVWVWRIHTCSCSFIGTHVDNFNNTHSTRGLHHVQIDSLAFIHGPMHEKCQWKDYTTSSLNKHFHFQTCPFQDLYNNS